MKRNCLRTKHFTWEEDIGLSIGDLEKRVAISEN